MARARGARSGGRRGRRHRAPPRCHLDHDRARLALRGRGRGARRPLAMVRGAPRADGRADRGARRCRGALLRAVGPARALCRAARARRAAFRRGAARRRGSMAPRLEGGGRSCGRGDRHERARATACPVAGCCRVARRRIVAAAVQECVHRSIRARRSRQRTVDSRAAAVRPAGRGLSPPLEHRADAPDLPRCCGRRARRGGTGRTRGSGARARGRGLRRARPRTERAMPASRPSPTQSQPAKRRSPGEVDFRYCRQR